MSAPEPSPDPRPLLGEPLALDLVNTRWNDQGAPRDLLDSLDGVATWLASAGLAGQARADGPTREALLVTRDAIAALLAGGAQADQGRRALNDVLGHGAVRRGLTPDGPVSAAQADDPAWYPAWSAAESYLTLLGTTPERIRRCAHPDCVLYFFDVSKNGTRRWCSMAGCGNRYKASRHYQRSKRDRSPQVPLE